MHQLGYMSTWNEMNANFKMSDAKKKKNGKLRWFFPTLSVYNLLGVYILADVQKVICTSFARLFVPTFNQSTQHKNILISHFTVSVGVRLTIKVCTWNVEKAHGMYMLSIKVCTWNVTYTKCQSVYI